jgi:hypothetical protein
VLALEQATKTVRAKIERDAAHIWGALGFVFGSVVTAGAIAATRLTK